MSNKTKHTPGPWTIQEFPPRGMEVGNYKGQNLRAVCDVPYMGGSDAEDEANARLIAAVPDLLKALNAFPLPGVGESPKDYTVRVGIWSGTFRDAALTKAKGEAR